SHSCPHLDDTAGEPREKLPPVLGPTSRVMVRVNTRQYPAREDGVVYRRLPVTHGIPVRRTRCGVQAGYRCGAAMNCRRHASEQKRRWARPRESLAATSLGTSSIPPPG